MWVMVRIVFCLSILVSPMRGQWRMLEVQGKVEAIVEESPGRHIILTGGETSCNVPWMGQAQYGCSFNQVYLQSGETIRSVLPFFYGDDQFRAGTSFRSMYRSDSGIVLVMELRHDIPTPSMVYVMRKGTESFVQTLSSLFVSSVCRNATVVARRSFEDTLARKYDVFTRQSVGEEMAFGVPGWGTRSVETGYQLIPPPDTNGSWRVSGDCGEHMRTCTIPGKTIARIQAFLEPYLLAMTTDSIQYVTYDLGLSWLRIPSIPDLFTQAGYTVKIQHITNDSVVVLNLIKEGSSLLICGTLGQDVWEELPPPPFPSLVSIGGGSLKRLFVTKAPTLVRRGQYGRTTDSVEAILALLDPTVGVAEAAPRPAIAKRIVHRGDRLSFTEDMEWTLYAIDGSIVDRGRSSMIPFDVPPGMYFLSGSRQRFVIAVAP